MIKLGGLFRPKLISSKVRLDHEIMWLSRPRDVPHLQNQGPCRSQMVSVAEVAIAIAMTAVFVAEGVKSYRATVNHRPVIRSGLPVFGILTLI